MTDTRATTRTDVRGADETSKGTGRSARAFDIRRVIGGLFVFYGLLVGGAGLVDGDAARAKAAGIDINLWAGLGMLLFGVGFLVWMRLNPVQPPPGAEAERADQTEQADRPVH